MQFLSSHFAAPAVVPLSRRPARHPAAARCPCAEWAPDAQDAHKSINFDECSPAKIVAVQAVPCNGLAPLAHLVVRGVSMCASLLVGRGRVRSERRRADLVSFLIVPSGCSRCYSLGNEGVTCGVLECSSSYALQWPCKCAAAKCARCIGIWWLVAPRDNGCSGTWEKALARTIVCWQRKE
jgi:hypothetical protein